MNPRWFKKRTPQIDPDVMGQMAEESLQQTKDQQQRVNALTLYLENRKGQNGFGEDFDITFRNPRSA